MEAPTEELVIEQANTGNFRGFRLCRCFQCRIVRRCIPSFDFYPHESGFLLCEDCFREKLKNEGITFLDAMMN